MDKGELTIFSSNKSFLLRNRITEVSVNHLLLQIESNSRRLSCIRFWGEKKKKKKTITSFQHFVIVQISGIESLRYLWTICCFRLNRIVAGSHIMHSILGRKMIQTIMNYQHFIILQETCPLYSTTKSKLVCTWGGSWSQSNCTIKSCVFRNDRYALVCNYHLTYMGQILGTFYIFWCSYISTVHVLIFKYMHAIIPEP